jgi:hypothetical protein
LACFSAAQARSAEIAISAPVNCKSAINALSKRIFLFDNTANLPTSCGDDPSLSKARVKAHRDCDEPWIWAPAAAFAGGEERLNYLLKLGKFGRPLNGKVVVDAKPRVPGEQHLALCDVSNAGGPPTDCDTVAILTESETWLRGDENWPPLREDEGWPPLTPSTVPAASPTAPAPSATAYPPPPPPPPSPHVGCERGGNPRVSGGITINWTTQATRDVELFSTSLASILSSRQDLQAEIKPLESDGKRATVIIIEASAPLRTSKTLTGGWREAFDFDVYVRDASDGQKLAVEISATFKGMVSRQAVGNQTEYHGLSDAQRNRYLTTFDSLVEQSILNACPNGKKIDGSHISCH